MHWQLSGNEFCFGKLRRWLKILFGGRGLGTIGTWILLRMSQCGKLHSQGVVFGGLLLPKVD